MVAMSDELAVWPGASPWRPLERAGEGATSVVWRAEHATTGEIVALKVARSGEANVVALAREAELLARVARRWGPRLRDAGRGFLALDWIEGVRLEPAALTASRESIAGRIAHAVGRGLEELHDAGAFHGDIKAANVLLSAPASRDSSEERGATLVDLGLGAEPSRAAHGGTLRYAAPELRESGLGGPASDLWALGLLIAEVLDAAVATSSDPLAAIASSERMAESEPWRWAIALLAGSAGARPSARWVADRARRWLNLAPDADEAAHARVGRVRRTYLRERARDVVAGADLSPAIPERARGWIAQTTAWGTPRTSEAARIGTVVGPLASVRCSRWLVDLVGPSAAHWPIPAETDALLDRLVELARTRDPGSWTLEDIAGPAGATAEPLVAPCDPLALVRDLARSVPSSHTLLVAEDIAARPDAPATLVVQLGAALVRRGELGRAQVALALARDDEAVALRGEVARRSGATAEARAAAGVVVARGNDGPARWSAQATLARLAWDAGDLSGALAFLEGARGPAAAEMRALVAWRQGDCDDGVAIVERALCEPIEADVQARLEGVRGMLELERGASRTALQAFGRAVELAVRAGAVLEEATYSTSDAAAASDAGELGRSLASATRAALLWERLGRPERAARAWLARAATLATLGAIHATDEAVDEAQARAREAGDERTLAYASWARVEARAPGDTQARAWSVEAAESLRGTGSNDELRAAARLLVWAPDAVDPAQIPAWDRAARAAVPPVQWEWWGARAHAAVASGATSDGPVIVAALLALVDAPAPLGSRGRALDAGARLAIEIGDGEAARRFEPSRSEAARVLFDATPGELRASLASVAWANVEPAKDAPEVEFAPAQVAQLEHIVRSLSSRERLRPLLEQVLDTMVTWTGVERGLLLLRAPDDRLVPRAARNLARRDLTGSQLALSQTIARRAVETRAAVVATDAMSSFDDVNASVHALRLRSVLAVPLIARGETLGVVYLDDRVRKGAFGPRELAWVRVVASQAAMAIADARDTALLRRAARRAERSKRQLEKLLGEREVELDAARTELELVRDGRETRYSYDAIAGRSEPMRDLLRLVDRVTASDVPVLIIGESGTGKELVARAVHGNGARARRLFVSENCASVPDGLLESALFGHVRGAFTGASATRAGLFDLADGGTLFLDEIGEMSLAMQSKLLRVLQDGEVRPIGGDRVRRVDVRVVGATHRDLTAMVADRTFREDLFYRLNVITLRVPSLRERAGDLPVLVAHFLKKHAPDRAIKVTRAAMTKLCAFPWPGNVRQLENELRRALVLCDGVIDVAELSDDVRHGLSGPAKGGPLDLRARVDALEAQLVLEALEKTAGNQTRAAQLLGLSRFGLQKMMKRLGVQADAGSWHVAKGRG
jgi:transcriptional regulator with GAF, ATPase, and Fis domain/serine/threonine protein kinase/tetratricopeptide (TPR) repeat protein